MTPTLRRFIAELICQAEEQGLMDYPVTRLYFPESSKTLNGKPLITVAIEVSEKPASDLVYGTEIVKHD
jgi:hypothetical protein